jgi:hypothetical protein
LWDACECRKREADDSTKPKAKGKQAGNALEREGGRKQKANFKKAKMWNAHFYVK